MTEQNLITLAVGALVAFLGLLYRYNKPLDPVKSWLEMFLSIAAALVVAFATGKFSPVPGGGDPVAAIQFFLQSAAILFAIVQVIYSALKQALPESKVVFRALS